MRLDPIRQNSSTYGVERAGTVFVVSVDALSTGVVLAVLGGV